jgi:hypothetical protein
MALNDWQCQLSHLNLDPLPIYVSRLVPTSPSFVPPPAPCALPVQRVNSPLALCTPQLKSSSSKLQPRFGGAGVVGLATYYYVYLDGSATSFSTTSPTPATKPRFEKSALDSDRLLAVSKAPPRTKAEGNRAVQLQHVALRPRAAWRRRGALTYHLARGRARVWR